MGVPHCTHRRRWRSNSMLRKQGPQARTRSARSRLVHAPVTRRARNLRVAHVALQGHQQTPHVGLVGLLAGPVSSIPDGNVVGPAILDVFADALRSTTTATSDRACDMLFACDRWKTGHIGQQCAVPSRDSAHTAVVPHVIVRMPLRLHVAATQMEELDVRSSISF